MTVFPPDNRKEQVLSGDRILSWGLYQGAFIFILMSAMLYAVGTVEIEVVAIIFGIGVLELCALPFILPIFFRSSRQYRPFYRLELSPSGVVVTPFNRLFLGPDESRQETIDPRSYLGAGIDSLSVRAGVVFLVVFKHAQAGHALKISTFTRREDAVAEARRLALLTGIKCLEDADDTF